LETMNCTLCSCDTQGQLCSVEYPNGQKLMLAYNENGLEKITTPVGNVLEVRCGGGRILQVTDETGRRTQYLYDRDYMTNVVHTDEGITHYEHDGNGHITAVTDHNGSCYMENEYDAGSRITKLNFPKGICQTFAYNDLHRRNTVYYSETGIRKFMRTIRNCSRNAPSMRTGRRSSMSTLTRTSGQGDRMNQGREAVGIWHLWVSYPRGFA